MTEIDYYILVLLVVLPVSVIAGYLISAAIFWATDLDDEQ